MPQDKPLTAQDYRQRAAQCFRLARGALSFEIANALSHMALEYEELARDAEANAGQRPSLERV
jgi:hypothetical protein